MEINYTAMKNKWYLFLMVVVAFSCKEDDGSVFDQTADERVAIAISNLKSELTAPANGWFLEYQPEAGMGSFHVLLKFNDNGKVNIKTDLAADDEQYFDQTVGYRIDNSMGLELIFETYSFFSFLFEQDQANFGAEFEFNFVNKTPDNALVFVSKSDRGTPSRLTLIPATAADQNKLGQSISANLDAFSRNILLTYSEKDIEIYLNWNQLRRNINFTYITKKSDVGAGQEINLSSGYVLEGNSIVLDNPLTGTFDGENIDISSIALSTYTETNTVICAKNTPSPKYEGNLITADMISLENSLFDYYGATFYNRSRIYLAPVDYFFDEEGWSQGNIVRQEIEGAIYMVLLYEANTRFEEEPLTAVGFLIDNGEGEESTFILKKFEPQLVENNLIMNFQGDFILYDNPNTSANLENIEAYLNKLTEGNMTYIYNVNQYFFEFHNLCNGWSFYFQAI